MSPHETELERRQRMAETAAYEPLTTGSEWELDAGSPLWAQQPDDPQLACLVADLVNALPEPMRGVVELRMWGRLTFEEIADELGLSSRGHAHVYWTRALDRLRGELTE